MLSNDLAGFARAIVRGEHPIIRVDEDYARYSAEVAVEVYRNNYRGNLHDALAGAYPVVKQLVGDDFFRFMARKFITQYPSRNANLHRYGAELAQFAVTFEPAKELIYLPDVARLEWACHRAYFADDGEVLDLNELAQIASAAYADLVLHLHPSCHLLHSGYPVIAIWNAHQPGAPDDFHIDLGSGPVDALVSRNNDVVAVTELALADAAWLLRIQAGTTLGDATAETMERHPDFDLLPALHMLVAQNIFAGFTLGATS
jgi:hypothetical protein